MRITCTNAACGIQIEASEQYAGRTVKCPKCQSPILVPTPVAPPAAAPPQAIPVQTESAPVQVQTPSRGTYPRRRKSSQGPMIAIGGLLVVLFILAAIFLFGDKGGNNPVAHQPVGDTPIEENADATPSDRMPTRDIPATSGISLDDIKPTERPEPSAAAGRATLQIDWLQSDRRGGAVFIDGKKESLPASGPITFDLSSGSHYIRMMRRGYAPVEATLSLSVDERRQFSPEWRKSDNWEYSEPTPEPARPVVEHRPMPQPQPVQGPKGSFDDWIEDYELAKRQASQQGKKVLIVFSGSDWCHWCRKMAADTYLQPGFRPAMEDEFVLVYINLPKNPANQQKVEDFGRNQRLSQQFSIRGFPTALVTDSSGRQIGAIPGYIPGGVGAFVSQIHRQVIR